MNQSVSKAEEEAKIFAEIGPAIVTGLLSGSDSNTRISRLFEVMESKPFLPLLNLYAGAGVGSAGS